jgi:endogenous inhibitor of DNA gyrase (YacG/DUF329 family)
MIRYQCEVCDRLKRPEEAWILGFAAERLGVTEARREIAVVGKWDDNRAIRPFAVHFCSEQCKQVYIDKMFGEAAQPVISASRKSTASESTRKRSRKSKNRAA